MGESGKNLTELVTLSEGGGEKVGKNWTELVTLFEGWLGESREELDRTGYPEGWWGEGREELDRTGYPI